MYVNQASGKLEAWFTHPLLPNCRSSGLATYVNVLLLFHARVQQTDPTRLKVSAGTMVPSPIWLAQGISDIPYTPNTGIHIAAGL